MNKVVVLLSIICIAGFGLSAQNNQSEKTNSIVFEKLVHDYGTITQGADGNCEFTFINKGEKPLVLTNVHASCGCTIPTWPKKPIQPGQKGVIKVKYNTTRIGNFSKSITVSSNAANSTIILHIIGNVLPKE